MCYVVFHDYGTEGWQIIGKGATMLEAVEIREKYIAGSGSGTTEIFEHYPAIVAYSTARDDYNRREMKGT